MKKLAKTEKVEPEKVVVKEKEREETAEKEEGEEEEEEEKPEEAQLVAQPEKAERQKKEKQPWLPSGSFGEIHMTDGLCFFKFCGKVISCNLEKNPVGNSEKGKRRFP